MHQGSVAEAAQLAFKALGNPNIDSKEKSIRVPDYQQCNFEVLPPKTVPMWR